MAAGQLARGTGFKSCRSNYSGLINYFLLSNVHGQSLAPIPGIITRADYVIVTQARLTHTLHVQLLVSNHEFALAVAESREKQYVLTNGNEKENIRYRHEHCKDGYIYTYIYI